MMRPDAKVYLYPKPVDFRNPIDGLAALVELDIKVAGRCFSHSLTTLETECRLRQKTPFQLKESSDY